MRNLGGSLGISLAQTMLVRREQFHHLRLIEHLTPYNAALRRSLPRVAAALTGSPGIGQTLAPYTALDATVRMQAGMLAYIDIFHLLARVTLMLLPIVFLLRTIKPGAAPAAH